MAILSKAMYQIMYPNDRELFATPRMRCAALQAAASLTRVFRIDDPPQTLSSKLICECKLKIKFMRILRQPLIKKMQSLQANCLAKIKINKEICSSIVVGKMSRSVVAKKEERNQGARNLKALEEKRKEKNMTIQ